MNAIFSIDFIRKSENQHCILSPLHRLLKPLSVILIAAFILASCRQNPGPTVQSVQPSVTSQAPTQAPAPTKAGFSEEIQATAIPQSEPPTPQKAASSGVTACMLITKEEAEKAIGSPVTEPIEQNYPPLFGCDYKATNLNKVGISLVEFDDEQQAKDAFQMEIDLNDYEEVKGIGDRALRPEILDICVLKGKYELSIGVINDDDKETRYEKAKELALIALSRLP